MKNHYKYKGVEIKEITKMSVHFMQSFQDWRVDLEDGIKRYFSSEKAAKSYINIVKGN